jgi:hypothetical protein
MQNEPTIQDVLDVIGTFAGSVDQRFEKIDQRFEKIDQRFEKIDQRFEKIDQRFEKIDQRFEKIESVMATKDDLANMATKDDLANMATKDDLFKIDQRFERIEATMATKSDLAKLEERIITTIDQFIALHQTHEAEIMALRSKCERMEAFIAKAAKQLNIEYVSS